MKTSNGKRAERLAYKIKMDNLRAEAIRVVTSGVCPYCGAGLRRNLAIAGWYQCQQFGADGFRKDSTKSACSFQCFTE